MKSNIIKQLIFLGFLFLSISAICTEDISAKADYAPQLFLDALTKINEAEILVIDHKNIEAIDMHLQAKSILDHLQNNYPDWHPEIVSFRKKSSSKRVNELDKTSRKIQVEKIDTLLDYLQNSTSDVNSVSTIPTVSDILDVLANDNELLKKEIKNLENKVQILEQEHIILLGLNKTSQRIIRGSLNSDSDNLSDNAIFNPDVNEEIILIRLLYQASMAEKENDFETARDAY